MPMGELDIYTVGMDTVYSYLQMHGRCSKLGLDFFHFVFCSVFILHLHLHSIPGLAWVAM